MSRTRADWRRECRELLQLTWPILIAQVAQIGMATTDTIMAGAAGADDLAAVAMGASLWVPVFLLIISSLTAVTALIARHWGARRLDEVAATLQQGRWLALGMGLAGAALLLSAEPLLHWMEVAPAIRGDAAHYLRAVALGVPAAALHQTLRGLSEGSGRSQPVMLIALSAFVLNIPLNALFIYGLGPLPALGGVGCGYATACTMWFSLAALHYHLRRSPRLPEQVWPRGWGRPQAARIRAIAFIGLPIGGAVFAEVSIFSVVTLLIGHMGATVVAAHQIGLNVASVVFMVPLSLGLALTVRVGQALGAADPWRARLAVKVGLLAAAGVSTFNVALMVLLPEPIVALYTPDPGVRELAAALLLYAAFYQLADAVQVAAAGALRGYHDTRVTLVITLFAYWGVGVPLGWLLGLSDWLGPATGVRGLWVGLGAGLSVAALLLGVRLARISAPWRHARGHTPGSADPAAG